MASAPPDPHPDSPPPSEAPAPSLPADEERDPAQDLPADG